jgi:hypothetical protein
MRLHKKVAARRAPQVVVKEVVPARSGTGTPVRRRSLAAGGAAGSEGAVSVSRRPSLVAQHASLIRDGSGALAGG